MAKHRLWTTVLFLGFGTYLILCIAFQIACFKQILCCFQGSSPINMIPFASLIGAWSNDFEGARMPLFMWFELAALMIPLGFILFLWVEDCTSFKSIAGITVGFSGILCATNFLLTAPFFDIDFIVSSLCGSFIGYCIAVIGVDVFFAKRIKPMLESPVRKC